jgi:ribosome-associated protein
VAVNVLGFIITQAQVKNIKNKYMTKKEILIVEEIKEIINSTLDEMKAKNVLLIDLEGKTDLASYMYIASGTSSRNVYAIASKLIENLKHAGINYVVEGLENADWVLVDVFDVIVHIFKEDVREYYNLEAIWQ